LRRRRAAGLIADVARPGSAGRAEMWRISSAAC